MRKDFPSIPGPGWLHEGTRAVGNLLHTRTIRVHKIKLTDIRGPGAIGGEKDLLSQTTRASRRRQRSLSGSQDYAGGITPTTV
jgi:hypothetical protein